MDKLKALIKKNKILYIVLSKIYNSIVKPMRKGVFKFYIKYLFCIKRGEISQLKKLGLTHITEYKLIQWRIGKEKDKAYRRYYKCNYNGKKAFVKVAQKDSTIKNEIRICNYLKEQNIDFAAKMMMGRENFYNNTDVLVMEYVDNLAEFSIPDTYEQFENFCEQMVVILNHFKKIGVVHADIHKGNLMINQENKIILLDFGISMAKNVKNDVDYNARPGTFFVQEGNQRKYDDAYSFVRMIQLWDINNEWKECEAYKKIVSLIGDNYETVSVYM